jgi:hypothetical protein
MAFVPNGFLSSEIARRVTYDEEGRLRDINISRGSVGGIADANSLFATEAEKLGSIAPFLRMNRREDVRRRNYIIQAGGACVYFDPESPEAPPLHKIRPEVPDPRTSFGHDSMDGTKMARGTPSFTVGRLTGEIGTGRT